MHAGNSSPMEKQKQPKTENIRFHNSYWIFCAIFGDPDIYWTSLAARILLEMDSEPWSDKVNIAAQYEVCTTKKAQNFCHMLSKKNYLPLFHNQIFDPLTFSI